MFKTLVTIILALFCGSATDVSMNKQVFERDGQWHCAMCVPNGECTSIVSTNLSDGGELSRFFCENMVGQSETTEQKLNQIIREGLPSTVRYIERDEWKREQFLDSLKQRISARLKMNLQFFQIEGRVKVTNRIYRKMFIREHVKEVYDIYGVRVIVKSIPECYHVMRILHEMFESLPNCYKDYIAAPKPDGYQSLHTTLISEEGTPFEVQIRTPKMHRVAVATYEKYKAQFN